MIDNTPGILKNNIEIGNYLYKFEVVNLSEDDEYGSWKIDYVPMMIRYNSPMSNPENELCNWKRLSPEHIRCQTTYEAMGYIHEKIRDLQKESEISSKKKQENEDTISIYGKKLRLLKQNIDIAKNAYKDSVQTCGHLSVVTIQKSNKETIANWGDDYVEEVRLCLVCGHKETEEPGLYQWSLKNPIAIFDYRIWADPKFDKSPLSKPIDHPLPYLLEWVDMALQVGLAEKPTTK
jgi:hypothetical protein